MRPRRTRTENGHAGADGMRGEAPLDLSVKTLTHESTGCGLVLFDRDADSGTSWRRVWSGRAPKSCLYLSRGREMVGKFGLWSKKPTALRRG